MNPGVKPPARRRSRLRLIGMLAATTLAAACGDASPPAGQVSFLGSDDASTTTGYLAASGDTVFFGGAVVENTGDDSATLTDASLLGDVSSSDAQVTTARVVDPAVRDGSLIGVGRWPHRPLLRASVPIDGYTLLPGAQAEVLVIVKVHRAGNWYWPRTALDYRVAGQLYRTTTPLGSMVCVPPLDRCDPAFAD